MDATSVLYLPTPQALQVLAPEPAYVPVTQLTQLASATAPISFDASPLAHAVQSSEVSLPMSTLYLPAEHKVQCASPAPEYSPIPHVAHASSETAPSSSPAFPAAHTVQSEELSEADSVLYLPEAHREHAGEPATA